MERLTEKQSSGFDLKSMNGEWCNKYCEQQRVQTCNECGIYQAIQKLAEYEDLDEQGLLLRLPCKVGDRLYRIDFLGFIISDTVHSIHILQNTAYLEMNYWDKDISLSEVGKTVFLTREEAEQKLKEWRVIDMTIDDIKKAIREIEISYDYNHSKNDYDILLNLTELANLIKTLQGKAIDDFAEKVKEIYAFTILEEEKLNEIAEQSKAGGENE